MKKIAIIGSGFSSLSAACYLEQAGNDVTIFEKNEAIAEKASQFKKDGFSFDTEPTFYWMPDVFDCFFADFNRNTVDYYELSRLDPEYKVYFEKDDSLDISKSLDKLYELFEKEEFGSSKFLKTFLSINGK